jgi:hypothetical protein
LQFFSSWNREWQRLKQADPGRRFHERYERRHSVGGDRPRHRLLYIAGGCICFTIGLVLRVIPFAPGGLPLLALGAGMLSRESRTGARWLDKAEVAARRAWSVAKKMLRRNRAKPSDRK